MKEIERKFLVDQTKWQTPAEGGKYYKQGYLFCDPEKSVRVRLIGKAGYLTIKVKDTDISRYEYEYEIPAEQACEMLDNFCTDSMIEKVRYVLDFCGMFWEVDVFGGDNEGLIIAEVELESEDQEITLPGWVDAEVTGDPKYLNVNLAKLPYKDFSG